MGEFYLVSTLHNISVKCFEQDALEVVDLLALVERLFASFCYTLLYDLRFILSN